MASDDGSMQLSVVGDVSAALPETSSFDSIDEASAFFEGGSLGYSATDDPTRFDGLELCCKEWQVEPLAVSEVSSSVFDDESVFPRGSIDFDCALLMRGIEHAWHGRGDLCCATADGAPCSQAQVSMRLAWLPHAWGTHERRAS